MRQACFPTLEVLMLIASILLASVAVDEDDALDDDETASFTDDGEPLGPADATTIYRGEQPGSALGLHLVACNLANSSRQDLVVGAPDVDDGDTSNAGAVYWIEP